MIVQDRQDIDWAEYIDQEVAKHPEFDPHLIDVIWDDLRSMDQRGKSSRCMDLEKHRSNMFAEARKAIDAVKETTRRRLMLHRWDEIQTGMIRRGSPAVVSDTGVTFDELDDLLGHHEPASATADMENCCGESHTRIQNAENESAESVEKCTSPATALITDYEFPETALFEPDYEHLTDRALTQALRELVVEQASYHVIRDRYTAVASIMNRRGACPPKFRPQRSLPRRKKDATDDNELMMRDRQVIDIHWLHCRGKRDIVPGKNFAGMFVVDELDFYLAGQFASKEWSHEIKAEKSLNLIPHEQLQLAILRNKAIADDWRSAERTMATTIEKRLRGQAVTTPSLKPHIEDFKHLWLAEKIVGRGKGRLPLVAQMHAWISGKAPLATSTLSEKLKRMRIRTGSNAGRIKGASGAVSGPKNS